MFAFAALCACNKEAQPEVPQILDADTYVKVNIMATGASTRAYEYGEEEENAVHNVVFLFYGEGDKPVLADGTTYGWEDQTSGNNVAVKSATVKFKAQTAKPTSMMVVLNYGPDESAINTLKGLSLSEAKAKIAESYSITAGTPAATYYTMSNSVYVDGSTLVCEVPLTDSNFGKTTEEGQTEDAVDPVDIYVERVAAKVRLNNKIEDADITSSTETIDGTPNVVVTPVVVGYDVVNTPVKSNLFKNLKTSYANYDEWTKPSDFRSFWAENCSLESTEYQNKTYDDIEAAVNPIYVHENTSASTTKVILTAYLTVPDDTFGTDGDSDPDKVNLVKYNSTYYTFEGFVSEAKKVVKASKGISIDTETLVAVPETNNYEMHLELAVGHGLVDADANTVNDALAMMIASYWKDGRCYYFTDIKHNLIDNTTSENVSGVVRNHVYDINLNSIKGLGIPVSGDDESEIVPTETSDEYYSLNATINILQWKVVTQEVGFDN